MNDVFENILLKDEEVLWIGQPENSIFSASDIFLVPFSLLWGGFAIFWEITAILSGAPFFFCLFGVPFVIVGLYIIFGRFIFKRYKKKHTYYSVTNLRILINSNLRESNLESVFIRQLPYINKSVRFNGIGTIKFGSTPLFSGMYGNTGMDFFSNGYIKDVPTFYDIKDVEKVYKLVSEIKLQS